MADHSIIDDIPSTPVTYSFEFWRGEPPDLPQQQVATHTRPGADGLALQQLGVRGRPLRAQLVSHFATYAAAIALLDDYYALAGKGLMQVVYNTINWHVTFGVQFYVDQVKFVNCQVFPFLIGPTYAYTDGAQLVTEWILTPQYGFLAPAGAWADSGGGPWDDRLRWGREKT